VFLAGEDQRGQRSWKERYRQQHDQAEQRRQGAAAKIAYIRPSTSVAHRIFKRKGVISFGPVTR